MTRSHDTPVVAVHHHLWDLGRNRYPWLEPGTPSIVGDSAGIRRDYEAKDYRDDTRRFHLLETNGNN